MPKENELDELDDLEPSSEEEEEDVAPAEDEELSDESDESEDGEEEDEEIEDDEPAAPSPDSSGDAKAEKKTKKAAKEKKATADDFIGKNVDGLKFGDLEIAGRKNRKFVIGPKGRAQLAYLANSPLIPTVIPMDPSNPSLRTEEFQINSLAFIIPRGVRVMVPAPVDLFIKQTVYAARPVHDQFIAAV